MSFDTVYKYNAALSTRLLYLYTYSRSLKTPIVTPTSECPDCFKNTVGRLSRRAVASAGGMAFLLETPFPYLLVSASLQLLALWLPPFRGRAVIFVPLIVLSAAAIYWPWENAFATDGARQRTYECYTFWVSTITTLEKLLFSTPEQSYWRVSKNIKREDVSSYGFGLKKLGWAFDLFANSRLIGWNQPVKGIVPVNMDKYHSKKWYLWVHFLEFVKLSLVLDLLYHFIRVQPTFKRMFLLENDGVSLADGPVVERFFTLWAFGISFCCIVKRVWVQGVLLGVGLGINDPKVRLINPSNHEIKGVS